MNPNTVQINIEIVENLKKRLDGARQSIESFRKVLGNLRTPQQQASELLKKIEADFKKLEEAIKSLGKFAGEQKGPLQVLAGQVKDIFGGLEAGAKENLFKTEFLFEQAKISFKAFQKSASGGLEDFLVVAFRNNTDKAEAQWKVFVKSLETAYLRMLAKIASAAIQENLLKPAPFALAA